jgi:Planctomycete cytochrome C/WD domain, G-beta repeat
MRRLIVLAAVTGLSATAHAQTKPAPDYRGQIAPIFTKYCTGCHNDEDREGKFSLESFGSLQKGTEKGPAILPGDPRGSLMIRVLTGAVKPSMPPKGEPRPEAGEIALIEAWIEAGAHGPQGQEPDRLALIVPKIPARSKVRPIVAIDSTRDGKWLAVARGSEVALYAMPGQGKGLPDRPERLIGKFPGKVTALHFTPDGSRLIAASGVAGLGGLASIWNVADGAFIHEFAGHRDILYDAEVSPDGKRLATCGYDKQIEIWDTETGKILRTLEGHTGAIYDVAFSPDGRFLVSASADDTCKVWRVEDGQRMDTLPQPLKAEYTCTFSPDGQSIVAGGADNNIRVWRFVARDKPEINPMVIARFAHEGPVVHLAFTPDGSKLVSLAEDLTVKVWRTSDYSELRLWEKQPDVATSLAFDGKDSFLVGRLDGSLESYTIPTEAPSHAKPAQVRTANVTPTGVAAKLSQISEHEPNNAPAQANVVANLPAQVAGTISGIANAPADADLYRFTAKAGEQLVFEVNAARSSSKLDSFIEILDSHGRRIPRVVLQAMRDSYFTFRGKDDTESGDFRVFNWQEMKLDEYLYSNGEVVKLWIYPRGPDSGFGTYPGQGSRWGYFDTTPLAHALGEPCYIVLPHPPGTKLVPNGLPVFSLNFENDDDSHRELGKDSRLTFTAPADGDYLVKIKDVRGLQGPDFRYSLAIRPRRADFKVTLHGADLTVDAGSAKEFKVTAQRLDDFEGPIRVDVSGLPQGFSSTSPLTIEAGQIEALGIIMAAEGTEKPAPEVAKQHTVTASAQVGDRTVTHTVNNLGTIKLAPAGPKLRVSVAPTKGGAVPINASSSGPLEFAIAPGQTIMLKAKVERNGFKGPVFFGNEGSGRNLPFGVIVDNLGLNGLLILENQNEREFFITADAGTREQTRNFHLTTAAAGGQSSRPVNLHVRRPQLHAAGGPARKAP